MTIVGVQQLAYLGFEVKDLAAWETFATRVLGLEVVNKEDSAFRLRMDSRAQRFFITKGPADDCSVLGWECASDADLDATVARLRGAGVDVREGTNDERALRGVRRLYAFVDPAGNPSELSCGPDFFRGGAAAQGLGLHPTGDALEGDLVISHGLGRHGREVLVDEPIEDGIDLPESLL